MDEQLLITGYPEDIDKKKIAMPGFFANLRTVREIPKLGSLPSSLALGILGMPGYVPFTFLGTFKYHVFQIEVIFFYFSTNHLRQSEADSELLLVGTSAQLSFL